MISRQDSSFNLLLLSHWDNLVRKLQTSETSVLVGNEGLDLASVIVVARYGAPADFDQGARQAVSKSASVIRQRLLQGDVIYGVNTGFGGSADTRTQATVEIQRGLLRALHYGVVADPASAETQKELSSPGELSTLLRGRAIPLADPVAATCMPESWVRASMLIRSNSLASGVSGISPVIIDTLLQLLNRDVVPMVPLRGSISASGDLSPLSYLGGVMQGKPALAAYTGKRSTEPRRLVRADQALIEAGIQPVSIGPKEGLAIVNGTATSAAVGALALHEAHCQVMLSQILTAMSVEALGGTDESFDPFFARVRPHPGQEESARNIFTFLAQSKLVYRIDGSDDSSLRQDRYSVRTASQWIGPVLEDLVLAHQQVTIELNSVTDNPLIDEEGKSLHGGNFQAKSITSAMEKTRQACQTIGRMLFTQCTEIINPATNRGLPPNLIIDEPSESWMFKGTDIMIAALQSELGFLANPVGSHVQSAEMGNQALNSLALISGRYTLSSIEILQQLSAAHLIVLCQALDLRAMHIRFMDAFIPEFKQITHDAFLPVLEQSERLESLQAELSASFAERLGRATSMDSTPRLTSVIESLQVLCLRSSPTSVETLQALQAWTNASSESAIRHFRTTRADYLRRPHATPFLGSASRRMYNFVRDELAVPLVGEEYLKAAEWQQHHDHDIHHDHHHSTGAASNDHTTPTTDAGGEKRRYRTMGEMITAVHDSMQSGSLYAVVVECLRESVECNNGHG
ncbi:MAG: hypothetical protein M1837_006894 [Sclerophora amabilis]|nr:MAG: hypothetical protein M1837_006894 [Sclerophora amabilis]